LDLRSGLVARPSPSARPSAPQKARSARARLASPTGTGLFAAIALGVIALAIGAVAVARGPAFPVPANGLLPADDSIQNILCEYISPELADGAPENGQDGPAAPPAPLTLELSTYTVKAADSLASIAKRFGRNIDTIISVNGISSSASVKSGAQLRIPNIDGLVYRVRAGDSLGSVARRYKTDATKILDANDLGSSQLLKGQSLFIPGARLPESDLRQALGPKVAWPVRGPLTSFFGYRPDPFTGVRSFHAGIDIAVDMDTPVHAAMNGTVADTGYNGNFGNYVILSHADGFQTLYGHLTSASVTQGQKIEQGDVVGVSGNTGYSTGPHVHFGLYRRGLPINPLKFLK
jgi:murein DD-endopeptidase MepM/ murein hydrolase activator NlpD